MKLQYLRESVLALMSMAFVKSEKLRIHIKIPITTLNFA